MNCYLKKFRENWFPVLILVSFPKFAMSDLQTIDVSVKDVYDFAYDIAQEFEKIVNIYGIDEIKPAVDKVINSLEILESCVKRIDQLKDELKDLKSSSLLLSSEKIFNENESSKLKQVNMLKDGNSHKLFMYTKLFICPVNCIIVPKSTLSYKVLHTSN